MKMSVGGRLGKGGLYETNSEERELISESPEKSLTTEAQRARRKKKVEVRRSFLCELP